MKRFFRSHLSAALMPVFILSFISAAYAGGSPPVSIQMLPPTPFGSTAVCSNTNELLVYSGNGNNQSGINCLPGVAGDASGNFFVTNGTLTAKNSFFLGATNVTASTTNLAILSNAGGCAVGEALTAGPGGNFSCISVADIPHIGTQTVPSCPTTQQIYFDPVAGFTCEPLPPSTSVTCGADQVVLGDGSNAVTCNSNFVADPAQGNVSLAGVLYPANGVNIANQLLLNSNGSASFAGGAATINTDGSIWGSRGLISLNADGSLSAAGGRIIMHNDGTLWTSSGNFWIAGDGGVNAAAGKIILNGIDGSMTVASGAAQIVANGGAILAAGQIVLNGINGSATFASGSSWCAAGGCGGSSDRRLKTDIAPITDALGAIEKLQGVRYKWRKPEDREVGKDMALPLDKPQVGFIAQDVEKVVPEAVQISNDTGIYGLEEQKIVPLLVEAVKEQQAEIKDLKAELAKLRSQ